MLLPRSPWCLLLLLFVYVLVDGQLMEEDRLKECRARNGEKQFRRLIFFLFVFLHSSGREYVRSSICPTWC